VKLDDKGFVCTGLDLSPADHEQWAPTKNRRHPLQLETSVPRVFAIGDARANSTKRVAAAVGEGAAVVAQVHALLALHEEHAEATHETRLPFVTG
jgi:thioredoxin reductase (NADPH)